MKKKLSEIEVNPRTRLQTPVREQMNLNHVLPSEDFQLGAWYLMSDGRICKAICKAGRLFYFCCQANHPALGRDNFIILCCRSYDWTFYGDLHLVRKLGYTPGKNRLIQAIMQDPDWNEVIQDEANRLAAGDLKPVWAPCIWTGPHTLIKPRSSK